MKGTRATVLVRGSRLFVACAALVGGITMRGKVHNILREFSYTGGHHIGDEQCNDLSSSGQRLTTVASFKQRYKMTVWAL